VNPRRKRISTASLRRAVEEMLRTFAEPLVRRIRGGA
jgi:hypothetical protein